ncbi:unnamed protein product [Mucor circinelloides]
MALFPAEILLNIFQHLSIYSQHQCLQVCRSWNAVARTFTTDDTHKVELYGYGGIRRLARAVATSPTHGLAVRQMYFIMQTSTGDPISQIEFINLIRQCQNLQEIIFVDVNPFYYIQYLCRRNVRLPQLELIRLGSRAPYYIFGQNYANLTFKYRATLNQLCVYVTASELSYLGVNSITDYLSQFPCLKYLSINTHCPIVFDALIRACPQLQMLRLRMQSTASFQVIDGDIIPASLNPVSQLETLKINDMLMTQQLYRYLSRCCTFLSQLVITLNSEADLGSLLQTFGAFDHAHALSISNISFNNYWPKANPLMQSLGCWFSTLTQIEIQGFDVASAKEDDYNVPLDFNQLNLLYISIDISSFVSCKNSSLARIALEITTGNATKWYQREGKWKTDKQFVLKDNLHYTNLSSREKRMKNDKTVVISIRASSIQSLRLLFTSHNNSFNQVIRLNQ